MLHKQAWQKIVIIERRISHDVFERGKAFNYQLDGRGQNMLASIGLDETTIQAYGIENKQFVLNSFCLLYTSPSPRDKRQSRMPSSA